MRCHTKFNNNLKISKNNAKSKDKLWCKEEILFHWNR